MKTLEELLEKEELKKVLIFGRTKRGVERLSSNLYAKGFKVASIHGDKPQNKRDMAIRLFKNNSVDILVATDVAARGLDIPDVTHVINFDEPATYDDYIHRIGRTGRGDKRGHALTFVD
jgi:superfamily II DNA/RNA helicase